MKKETLVECTGIVIETLPNAMFKVKLINEKIINTYISGKIRKNYIKISKGDNVTVQYSCYDDTKGRIIYRNN